MKIRPLAGLEEHAEAVRLQREIWGFADLDVLPVRFFVVARSVGGQTLGAFDGRKLVAFLLAIPGVKPNGRPYLHSHMLGVLPEYRDRGLGYRLKMAQRDDALARGFKLIEWTFDPFNAKNAYFNIERLGAVVTAYESNLYGITTSALQAGTPTDRAVVQWWISPKKPYRPEAAAQVVIDADRPRFARRFRAALKKGYAATSFDKTGIYGFSPYIK